MRAGKWSSLLVVDRKFSPFARFAMATTGATIQCRAAVLRDPGSGYTVETINVDPPQAGEVRVKILFSSLCHTDFFPSKAPASFDLPIVVGHEGSGIVERVGDGVNDIAPGDHVICTFLSECKKCKLCNLSRTNLCEVGMANLTKGVMPADQKTRFSSLDGTPIHHFVNTSTFTEFTVVTEASVVKIDPFFPLEHASLLSCGVPTGLGSALNIANVVPGSTVAVIGLGTVGLAAVEGARIAGAARIIGVDILPSKFEAAKAFGATECLNPNDYKAALDEVLRDLTNGGVDYCIECVGNPRLVAQALQSCATYGTAVMVGVCEQFETLTVLASDLMPGRHLTSGFFGGYRSKSHMHKILDLCSSKEVNLDRYITHRLPLAKINEGFELLSTGSCLKCVFTMSDDNN